MKKFYSILALAFMCMVGTASAESLTLNASSNRKDNPTVSDGVVTFTLNNARFENGWDITHLATRVYMVDNNVDAYLNWSLNDASKTIKIQSVEFYGRCEFNGNYITAETNYMPRPNIIIENRVLDFGKWYTTEVSGEYLFGPAEDLTGGEIHLVDHRANIANGGCQIQHITINYTVVEKAATHTVYATPENEVVFGGDWTEGEISEALEGTIPVRGGGEIEGSQAGIVVVTGVDGLNGHSTIVTPNPNTLIEANEGQVSNPQNVIVNDFINNLVVVDPLVGGHPQDGTNYVNCGWYLKRDGLKAAKASYSRPMTYHYATVAIPFGYSTSDINAQVEEITEMNLLDYYIVTNKIESDGVTAGQAVIVYANGDININTENVDVVASPRTGSILVPTFTEMEIGMGQYAIAMDQFWNAGYADRASMTVMPFRAWFGRPQGMEINAKSISIVSQSATAINNVEATTTIAPAYNLQGVRVAPNAKGFVISNGKKYFNK